MSHRGMTLPLVLLAAAGVLACSDNSPPATTTMDADAANTAGREAAGLFAGTASGLMAFDPSEALLGIDFLVTTGVHPPSPRRALASVAQALAGRAPGCNPAQTNSTDTDGDGVFDDNTLTFTAANCTTDDGFGTPVVTTGTVRIQDQGSLFGWDVDFSAFTVTIGDPSDQLKLTVNGNYQADVGAAGASAGQRISARVEVTSGESFFLSDDWALGFTPDANGVIAVGDPWPAGAFDLAGDFRFSVGGKNYALGLVTTAPLAIDGQCAENPPFQSGQVVGALTAAQSEGVVITFNGCGLDPTIEALANRLQ